MIVRADFCCGSTSGCPYPRPCICCLPQQPSQCIDPPWWRHFPVLQSPAYSGRNRLRPFLRNWYLRRQLSCVFCLHCWQIIYTNDPQDWSSDHKGAACRKQETSRPLPPCPTLPRHHPGLAASSPRLGVTKRIQPSDLSLDNKGAACRNLGLGQPSGPCRVITQDLLRHHLCLAASSPRTCRVIISSGCDKTQPTLGSVT